MRLIVACKMCKRQYDAAGRKVGGRFRCHCGETVKIEEPKGHDASVVRCSACGAPCEEESSACRFCLSDYTIHERDMHTVCPSCLARISDRAKFCHHCGLGLTPELSVGENSDLACPTCKDKERGLVSRNIGELSVAVLECPYCAGMWLGEESFQQLAKRVHREAIRETKSLRPPTPVKTAVEKNWRYRPCVVCGELMTRKNFARTSGVAVDVCRDHGIWFDDNELHQIVTWIEHGGLVPDPKKPLPKVRSKTIESGASSGRTYGEILDGDIITSSVFASVLEFIISIALRGFRKW